MDTEKKKSGLIMVLISGFAFGIMPLAVTVCCRFGAVKQTVAISRFLLLALVLLPVVLGQKGTFRLYAKNFWKILLMSAACAITPVFLFSAYEYQSTGLTTTLHFLFPAAVVLFDRILYRKKLTRRKGICLLLCVAGVLLLLDYSESGSVTGVALTFASVVAWALYIVLMDHLRPEGVSSTQMMFYVSTDGAVMLALYALITGTLFVELPLKGVLAVVGATLMIAVFGSLFFALGIRSTDAQTAAIASTLEPITSLAAGAIFLNETVGLRSLIGALLILSAVVLVSIAEKKKT